jgi:hypothetical protein
MHEPEILEAYRNLSNPVSAPPDLLEKVERRITRRRRVRRGAVAVAAVAVVGGVGVGVLGGGDGGGDDRVADDPGGTDSSTLTYTDTDGSTYSFEAQDIGITCRTSDREGKSFEVLTLTLNAMLPAAAQVVAPPDEAFTGPVLHVEVLTEKVEPGQVFPLPYETVDGSSSRRAMTFFFTNGIDDDSNELSSAESDSSGTVTVHEATCGPDPSLWVEIDGTLGSEVEQPPVAIKGEYRS